MSLTLSDRAEIAAIVWPGPADIGTRINRAALVHDVQLGLPVLALTPDERRRVVAALADRYPFSREPVGR